MATSQDKKDKKATKKKRPWWRRVLRFFGRTLLVLLTLFILLVLFIRSPWGQDIIVGKLTSYLSDKTKTKVSIDKLFITFSGDIDLQGLYLEDLQGDTLVYSKELQVEIPLWPIIRGNPISIDGLEWTGLTANVYRKDSVDGFNFQFLIDAFASDSAKVKEEKESTPPKISLGSIDLSDFNITFNDAVGGIKANLKLGNLFFEGDEFDLEKMKFLVEEINLEDTKVNFVQSKPNPPSDTTASELPYLGVEDLKLKNVLVHYISTPAGIDADLDLADLQLQVPKADLNQQDIEVSQLILNNSNIQVKIKEQQNAAPEPEDNPTTPIENKPFIWPNWNVRVETIALQNNHIHYQLGEKSKNIKDFDPNYIVLDKFNFKADDILLSKAERAKIHLEDISFHEASGLTLKQLAFYAKLDPTTFSLVDLNVKTGKSSINANIKAQFASIQAFIDKPENARLNLDLKQFIIDLNDAFTFQPELRKNETLKKLAKHKFTGEIQAKGKLSEVDLSNFLVKWGKNTSVKTHGELKNLTDFEHFIAEINNLTIQSSQSDLSNFISEEDIGISIPKTILLQTELIGSLDNFQTKTILTIPEGKIKIDGDFKQQEEIAFNANVSVINLKLGQILNNPKIGLVDFKLVATGKGNTINDLNAKLASDFSKLEFSGYNFSALKLDGEINNGDGAVAINYNDANLELDVNSQIHLDSIAPKIAIDFNLEGADLYALGLTEKQVRAKLILTANFEGNTDKFEFESHVLEGVAVYDESTFHLGTIDITAAATQDSTSMDIMSDFLNGKLRANSGIDSTVSAVQYHLMGYFSDSIAPMDSVQKPVKLQLDMKLSESKLFTDFLVPDIKTMDTLILKVDFDQQANQLTANLDLPYFDYADKTIDSLQLRFNSTDAAANFRVGFAQLNASPLLMNTTYFEGDLKYGMLDLKFNAFDNEKETYYVRTEISGKRSNLKIHFVPEKLILLAEEWSVPDDNEIIVHEKDITAENVVFTQSNQRVTIANDLIEASQNNIGVGFENFKLENVMALFNKKDLLASGDLQGNIVAIDPFDNIGLNADFSIENLVAMKAPLGKLTLLATTKKKANYDLDLSIKGDDVDIEVKGDYAMQNVGSELEFKADLTKIGMKTIAIISGDNLKDASGSVSGDLAIHGAVSSPEYEGQLKFNDAKFNVSQLNSTFRLMNDKIDIDQNAITFNQFSIRDEQNNQLSLDGTIKTETISDPEFDLTIKTKNFQALNSTEKDNELYYGKVNFDLDGTIGGKLSFPVVNATVELNKNTDFTYVIPDSQAKLEKRDGIVEFVNKEDPDNILTRTTETKDKTLFDGIEVHAKLKIAKEASFNVIVVPETGDNLNVSGEGDLDFNIARNGLTTLNGRYEINNGHYSLSLYNLVKRKFDFEKGSFISWSGDPMDANLNVTAKYELETSATGLMAAQTANANDEMSNRYRQKLPFFVYMNVKGELNQPQLGFQLDMPEDSRGAIDGTVYGRIKQVNSEEDELNKQVFSLLVLNKFYPNAGSDGSGGGAASIVRKNVNDALSDQLNAFSGKLTGNTGIELDFGLNSYTDYQGESAQERTDLNITAQKKLLNDRLIVEVGSNVSVEGSANPGEENPVVGNASIQYLITEDGRYRLKGFRNSEYENVIDGQIYVNGISLIFQRQFNQFSELFSAPPEVEEEENEKSDAKEELNSEEKKESEEQESEPEKKENN